MTDEQKQEKVKKIFTTYAKGGSMAHNIITLSLQSLAKHDKPLADKTYATLEERGF